MTALAQVLDVTEGWRHWRGRDLTASRISGLWGAHPRVTPEALLQQMRTSRARSNVVPLAAGGSMEPSLRRGRIAEPAIAAAVQEERPRWRITRATTYHRIAEERIGATPDFWLGDDGLIEAKSVSPDEWCRWGKRPPLGYHIQTAVQMYVTGRTEGHLAIMVMTPDLPLHLFPVACGAAVRDEISTAAAAWWAAFDRGDVPPVAPIAGIAAALGELVPAALRRRSSKASARTALKSEAAMLAKAERDAFNERMRPNYNALAEFMAR